jgi:energy-converting hydrogenase Eha subunit E
MDAEGDGSNLLCGESALPLVVVEIFNVEAEAVGYEIIYLAYCVL